jgi:predicted MPP superfamily phosphohydrolase
MPVLSAIPTAPLHALAAAVLLVGVCAGHTTLFVRLHNWLYGVVVSHFWNHWLRVLAALAGPATLFALWYAHGLDLTAAAFAPSGTPGSVLLAGYLVVCLLVGYGVLPAVTVYRLRRRPPAALASNHTHTVDVAKELGYRPLGRGKHRLAARLPGNEVFQADFRELTVRLPRLPAAWDGLTVLHLSDLHLCGTPDRDYFEYVMERCATWEPDLVALTGDVVDSKRHHRWIVPVLGRLRWRVAAFAILGNHDSWLDVQPIRRRLRRVGMRVLANTWERHEVRGQPLVVIGHEGPWFPPGPDLAGCPADGFRLCLSHTPDHLGWARRHGIDLMLAGHVHGGQVRLPVLGSVFVPSRFGRRYDCGTFYEPPTLLHVSRGLGGDHPLRYNCRPEVTKLVLRRADPNPPSRGE